MTTQKQTGANRLNAKKSSGPRSARGRARSSMNALQTGLQAKSILLPGENPAELQTLIAEYHDYHEPRSPEARNFCDQLARGEWLQRRYADIEAKLFTYEIAILYKPRENCLLGQAFKSSSGHLSRLQHHRSAAAREYHRDLQMLHALEAEEDALIEDEVPEPEPPAPEPELSTEQPTEPKTETPKMASFSKTPTPPPAPQRAPAPAFRASSPQKPFHPGHPVMIEDCPNCSVLGYMSPSCRYDPNKPKDY